MGYTFEDMNNSEHLKEYALPGGKHVEAMDPLVDRVLDSGFFGAGNFLIDDTFRPELEETARAIIGLARNAVKEGFPVDALDYRVESALHHFPFSEQEEIRKEFRLPGPHISKECEIALY